jgi:hypothetical protein
MKRKNVRFTILAAAVGACGLMLGGGQAAHASILATAGLGAGPVDTIYADNFSGTAGTQLTAPSTDNGYDGGTPGATWATTASTSATTDPDANWLYSGSNSVTITTPGSLSARDTNLISNAVLPLTPQAGYIYDLEATLLSPLASGDNGHWSGLTYAQGTQAPGGGSSALSNDGDWGLMVVRDNVNPSPNWVSLFAGGTGGQVNLNPAGGVGTALTLDIVLNTAASTMSYYINGSLVSGPTSVSGFNIKTVAFGDDTAPTGTVSNFSLTAQAVPEPASTALLLVSAGLTMKRRRRLSL